MIKAFDAISQLEDLCVLMGQEMPTAHAQYLTVLQQSKVLWRTRTRVSEQLNDVGKDSNVCSTL